MYPKVGLLCFVAPLNDLNNQIKVQFLLSHSTSVLVRVFPIYTQILWKGFSMENVGQSFLCVWCFSAKDEQSIDTEKCILDDFSFFHDLTP